MNLLRGSGLSGLKGIEPIRGKIIRPLIEISRKDIELFCEEKNINPHYFRNNQGLLLEDSTIIKTNFEILENYDLLLSLKTGIDCNFLINKDLITVRSSFYLFN